MKDLKFVSTNFGSLWIRILDISFCILTFQNVASGYTFCLGGHVLKKSGILFTYKMFF